MSKHKEPEKAAAKPKGDDAPADPTGQTKAPAFVAGDKIPDAGPQKSGFDNGVPIPTAADRNAQQEADARRLEPSEDKAEPVIHEAPRAAPAEGQADEREVFKVSVRNTWVRCDFALRGDSAEGVVEDVKRLLASGIEITPQGKKGE